MNITIHPSRLQGSINAIPSKSQAHRLLICAALADRPTMLLMTETNRDIDATAACLNALGADIIRSPEGYHVTPIKTPAGTAVLPCGESGSTLRFLLPLAGALGIDATFILEGRLSKRPLSPLWEEMERMGCTLSRPTDDTIRCHGKLTPGCYTIDGGVSSQFFTGLLFGLSLLSGTSRIQVQGTLESKPYVDMTLKAMEIFGVNTEGMTIHGVQQYRSPGTITVEGDWSNGAFFLGAMALGSNVSIHGLDFRSAQGDKAVWDLMPRLKENITISAKDIPDLVPILSVVAAANKGAVFTEIGRLRMKESDRVATVIAMLKSLGGWAEATDNTLTVYPSSFQGGIVDAANDHRIAMSAAIAATVCTGDVTILGAQCVSKSYPTFFEDFSRLGGNYGQYIR